MLDHSNYYPIYPCHVILQSLDVIVYLSEDSVWEPARDVPLTIPNSFYTCEYVTLRVYDTHRDINRTF